MNSGSSYLKQMMRGIDWFTCKGRKRHENYDDMGWKMLERKMGVMKFLILLILGLLTYCFLVRFGVRGREGIGTQCTPNTDSFLSVERFVQLIFWVWDFLGWGGMWWQFMTFRSFVSFGDGSWVDFGTKCTTCTLCLLRVLRDRGRFGEGTGKGMVHWSHLCTLHLLRVERPDCVTVRGGGCCCAGVWVAIVALAI
jgi:hypothetical protein